MPELATSKDTMPFKVDINNRSPEELEAQAQQMREAAELKRRQQYEQQNEVFQEQRTTDMEKLTGLHGELGRLDEAVKLAGKLSLAESTAVIRQRKELSAEIDSIESKYGIGSSNVLNDAVEEMREAKGLSTMPTIMKVLGLIATCAGIVLFSGSWIIAKYPNAAVYNEVSFQKVLFGFAVFIFAIVAVITALSVFFPGMAKYFNPFKSQKVDFYKDFKTLTEWQRTALALALFSVLLLAFVLTVSGKLD